VIDLACGFLKQLQAFFEREEWLLFVIVRHGHNDFIEEFSRSFDHIQVAIGHRIKAAWINRASHLRKFAEEIIN
jgi:hypothetical protein